MEGTAPTTPAQCFASPGSYLNGHTPSMSWLSNFWSCKFYFSPLDAGGQSDREEMIKGKGRVKKRTPRCVLELVET